MCIVLSTLMSRSERDRRDRRDWSAWRASGVPRVVQLAACVWLAAFTMGVFGAVPAGAQIRVNPTGVSVNSQNGSTIFLTFGNVGRMVPVEAFWCGDLIPAAPDRGNRCNPSTLFGCLPLSFDRARASGIGAVTDIMAIPPSVARRAWQDAARGAFGTFFYVRRFRDPLGGADEYVSVVCRLTDGGANVPLSLNDVALAFSDAAMVAFTPPGVAPPPLAARIRYNGTGRLKGRWEVVRPGDLPPTASDRLTEATLPREERGTQQRYTEVGRFNEFLPPNGSLELRGPDPSRLPVDVEGTYLVLLRIEADDDRVGISNLGVLGAGEGTLASGAVAAFPLPVLRYVVGAGEEVVTTDAPGATLRLLLPREGTVLPDSGVLVLTWIPVRQVVRYRMEIETVSGERVFTAFVAGVEGRYVVPPSAQARMVAADSVRWRVVALAPAGRVRATSAWRRLGATTKAGAVVRP